METGHYPLRGVGMLQQWQQTFQDCTTEEKGGFPLTEGDHVSPLGGCRVLCSPLCRHLWASEQLPDESWQQLPLLVCISPHPATRQFLLFPATIHSQFSRHQQAEASPSPHVQPPAIKRVATLHSLAASVIMTASHDVCWIKAFPPRSRRFQWQNVLSAGGVFWIELDR